MDTQDHLDHPVVSFDGLVRRSRRKLRFESNTSSTDNGPTSVSSDSDISTPVHQKKEKKSSLKLDSVSISELSPIGETKPSSPKNPKDQIAGADGTKTAMGSNITDMVDATAMMRTQRVRRVSGTLAVQRGSSIKGGIYELGEDILHPLV